MLQEYIELEKKYRDTLIHNRTKQEMAIQTWAEKLRKINNPDILKDVGLPEEITLRAFVPELYEENPRQEIYHEQYLKMCEVFNKVNAIAEAYNQEAKQCLLKFQELSSQQ